MNNSIRILVKRDEVVMEGLKPFFVAVEKEDWKFDMLCDLYNTLTITQAISALRSGPVRFFGPLVRGPGLGLVLIFQKFRETGTETGLTG